MYSWGTYHEPVLLSEEAAVGPHGGVVLHPDQANGGEEDPCQQHQACWKQGENTVVLVFVCENIV